MDIMAQTRGIYNHLCDEKSKRIFENRLLYSISNDYNFINNILYISYGNLKDFKNRNSFFEEYKNKNIVVYGAGYYGECFAEICCNLNIGVLAFCDSDAKKHGQIFVGRKIISPEQLKNEYKNIVVVITASGEKAIVEITEQLLAMGIENDLILNLKNIYNTSDIDEFHPKDKQYFIQDIILSRFTDNEVFIDGGCYDCNTDIQFTNYCNSKSKKIIAFEPNPNQYSVCVENSKSILDITVYPYALWNENAELSFDNNGSPGSAHVLTDIAENAVKIKAVKLDDILNGKKATFIKLDIEGAELNALKGAEQTILKYRPKLAICLYHKPEDIWEIPAYILSLHNDYKLYIRHHLLTAGETVLYAV